MALKNLLKTPTNESFIQRVCVLVQDSNIIENSNWQTAEYYQLVFKALEGSLLLSIRVIRKIKIALIGKQRV